MNIDIDNELIETALRLSGERTTPALIHRVLGSDTNRLERDVSAVLEGRGKKGTMPELWDGHAADRIADALQ